MTLAPGRKCGRASRASADERVGGHVEGQREAVARRVDERAVEVLAVREGEGVDEDVEAADLRAPAIEDGPDRRVVADVAGLHERAADRLVASGRTRFSIRLSTRAEADGRAVLVERPRDAPGDRVVVGDPEDRARSCRPAGPSRPSVVRASSGGIVADGPRPALLPLRWAARAGCPPGTIRE